MLPLGIAFGETARLFHFQRSLREFKRVKVMGTVPLPIKAKIKAAERFIPALCIAASIIGAGFVFFGGIINGGVDKQVTLIAGDYSGRYFTGERTIDAFFDDIGLEYSEFDRVEPSIDTAIRDGMAVNFRKAKQVYISDAGGDEIAVMCAGASVCDLISAQGLDIGPLDRVEPHPSTSLVDDMRVIVDRVEVIDITAMHEIEPDLEVEADPELPRGRMVEIYEGEPGLAEDVTRHYYLNGEQTTTVELGRRVVRQPVARQARVGVRSMPALASRGGFDRTQYGDVLEMDATAYDPGPGSCWPYADGKTATGHIAGFGVCAVDPDVIPLGTELWVEGYGYVLACDVGGAINGMRIDMCFDTYAEAMRWGRRDVLVYVLN